MQPLDLPAVLRIQAECFDGARQESQQSFQAKLAASPSTCFVAVLGPAVAGYLVAVPADSRNPPALNGRVFEVPRAPDCLYLHDLSVSRRARGSGVADALVEAFLSRLRQLRLPRACLTAVNRSSPYWARHGFQAVPPSDRVFDSLSSYGPDAQYMVRLNPS